MQQEAIDVPGIEIEPGMECAWKPIDMDWITPRDNVNRCVLISEPHDVYCLKHRMIENMITEHLAKESN